MSGPIAAVAPRNSGYEGGTLRAATRPTDVGGAFSASLSASVPTAVAGGEIYSARQSRGTNIRIPQSRLVPLSGPQCKLPCKTIGLLGASTEHRFEYSNLKPGELAWVLGRVFQPDGDPVPNSKTNQSAVAARLREAEDALLKHIGADALQNLFTNDGSTDETVRDRIVEAMSAKDGELKGRMLPNYDGKREGYPFGMTGTHHGFDHARFERLASTDWVESYVQNVLNQKGAQPLVTNDMFSNAKSTALDSDLDKYASIATGRDARSKMMCHATLFAAPDVAYALSEAYTPTNPGLDWRRPDLFATEVPKSDMRQFKRLRPKSDAKIRVLGPQLQGLFVMEDGPFLRSMCLDNSPVKIRCHTKETAGWEGLDIVPRNWGSVLCHKALYQKLRQMGLMNWTPDGVVLSKFDTGNGAEDEGFFDAAMGQLYNVGVQGPTITRSWSENIENLHMHRTTAMDRVFVLVVGRVTYKLEDGEGTGTVDHLKAMAGITKAMHRAQGVGKALEVGTEGSDALTKLVGSVSTPEYTTVRKAYVQALLASVQPSGDAEDKKNALLKAKKEFEKVAGMGGGGAASDMDELFSTGADGQLGEKGLIFAEAQTMMRQGKLGVSGVELSDLRLMRATSAFLINNSNPRNSRESARVGRRCGLQSVSFDVPTKSGSAEFILGGWSIGSVLDTAASRAALSVSQASVKPETHALNVNVNVEWWTADDLYNAYMDVPAEVKGGRFANEGSVRSLREAEATAMSSGEMYTYQPSATGISVDNNDTENGHTCWQDAIPSPPPLQEAEAEAGGEEGQEGGAEAGGEEGGEGEGSSSL